MEMIDPAIERYALAHTTALGADMDALEHEARTRLPNPEMLSGPVVGRLLATLAFSVRARRILEIGTYAGYSALAMASVLPPDGELITCELSEEYAQFARDHFAGSPYGALIRVERGPALQTVGRLAGPFDLVFIDAEKTGYRDYFESTLPLLSPHGLIVLDNTLRGGAVLDDQSDWNDSTRAIDELNRALATDERVVSVLLTVRDGVTVVRRA